MASSSTQSLKLACPKCGAKYEVPATMAGKSGPCAKCGTLIKVPAAVATAVAVKPAAPRKKATPTTQYVPIDCRVCQTHFYGRPEQIGKELKCPDCGAANIVRPPREAPAKKQPAALEGEQYEVYGVDEQPLPSEL